MPDDAPTPADVLDHLDALYALARMLTPDDAAASDLVQTTIRRIQRTEPPAGSSPRAWFTQMLLDTHARDPLEAPPQSAFRDVRTDTAQALIDRLLPTAFISRPHTERVLLTLCDLNDLSPEDAARLLDADASTVEQRLDAARTHLWETLKAGATPPERRILQKQSSPSAVVEALPAVLPSTLVQAPSTLGPAASALLQEEQAAPEAAPERAASQPKRRRSPRRSRRSQRDRSSLGRMARRAGAAIVIITVAGLLAYLLSSMLEQPASESAAASLIERTVAQTDQAAPLVSTSDPAEAEQYVRDQTGRSLAAPQIEGMRLTGAGTVEVVPQVTLPAFFFADSTTGTALPAYVFDYAMLDEFGDRIALATEVRRALEDEQAIASQRVDRKQVLIWRRRDDIYLIVAPESIEALPERIAPAN